MKSEPDTTPQNLKMIRDYVEIRSQFDLARLRGVDRMLADALAMIDALEAQIRDLTRPEEDVAPGPQLGPDGRCLLCGAITLELTQESSVWLPPKVCPNCKNPKRTVSLP